MTENGLLVLGGPETQLHDILWAVHDGKIVVEVRARKISGSSREWWVVGPERCTEGLHVYRTRTRVGARRWALTKPERLHRRLRVTEPERSVDGS